VNALQGWVAELIGGGHAQLRQIAGKRSGGGGQQQQQQVSADAQSALDDGWVCSERDYMYVCFQQQQQQPQVPLRPGGTRAERKLHMQWQHPPKHDSLLPPC